MENVAGILGKYTYHFIVILTSLPMMLFCILLFAWDMNRRKGFPFRLILGILMCLVTDLGLAILRTHFDNLYTRILVYSLAFFSLLALLFLCYQEPPVNILLNWCAAVAVQDIPSRLFSILVALYGNNPVETVSLFADTNTIRDWVMYYGIQIAITLVLYVLFRHAKCLNADKRTVKTIVSLSMFCATWMILIHAFSREYMSESNTLYMIIRICCTTFSVTVLVLRKDILSQNLYRLEITMTEKLLSEERKLYDSTKENIAIVNMRCHDLKHQLEALSYKLTTEELQHLKEAIKIYDNSIKTGSEVLDIVIYEKQLVFNKEGIRFTVMADGSLLSFMRTTYVYALFNNALGNALEAVRKLDNPDMRVIDLTVRRIEDMLVITVTNYYNGELNPDNATTKEDKSQHGLGIKSMKYIAELYGGTLSTSADGCLFELCCRIPIPAKEST